MAPENDAQVTLTASFRANDSALNPNVEKADDFGVVKKSFTVTVKGNGQSAPTEEELLAILDKYYPNTLLLAYGTDTPADLNNCQSDIQLPRYTRIKDEQGRLVFANKEITVTSDNPIITVNGYRAAVDIFHEEDTTVNLTISFTREGVTVKRTVPVTVRMISNAALDAEIVKMETAKAHYFDGLNDGSYTDKDSVTGNLHAFIEMNLDESGAPVWVYDRSQAKEEGIIADDMFDDPWEMESAGYNHFKSSHPDILKHENLVLVQQPETDTQVTITSMLSSEKYGKFAKAHPENEKLQKLYRQEVSVTVTVKGRKSASEGLTNLIQEAQKLLESITEGEKPGEYPVGTKKKLETAIAQAQAVLETPDATQQQYQEASAALQSVIDEIKASVIAKEAVVRVVLSNTDGLETQLPPTLTVSAGTAAKYGYKKDADLEKEVTVLDALAAIHASIFGEAYGADPTTFFKVNESGWITTVFGEETTAVGFMVNHKMPQEGGAGAACSRAVLNSSDQLNVFRYKDLIGYSDRYLYFDTIPEIKAGETVSLKVLSPDMMGTGEPKPESFVSIEVKDPSGSVVTLQTDMQGTAEFTPQMAGAYTLKITGSLMWTDIIAADGEKAVEVLPGEEQAKSYLGRLLFKDRSTTVYDKTFEAGEFNLEYTLPANKDKLVVSALLSENAPKGTTVTARYKKNGDGEEVSVPITNLATNFGYQLALAKTGMAPVSLVFDVGVEGDMQTYTFTMPRSMVLDSISFALDDGTKPPLVDGVYYLPSDYEGSVAVTANSYGAELTVNGDLAEDTVPYTLKPEFDEQGNCAVSIKAVSGEDSLTRDYVLRRLSETEPVKGSCGENTTWAYLNGTLTISGSGATDNWTMNKTPDWKSFANEITSVVVEKGVTGIGDYAFYGLSSLKNVTLPEGLKGLGRYLFRQCTALENITIPNGIDTVGNYLFDGCNALKSATVGSLGDYMFSGCGALEAVMFTNAITKLPRYAFQSCTSLKRIAIPETVTEVGDRVFYGCTSLESAETGILGEYMFSGCTALKSITLRDTVKNIPKYAFSGCSGLETLELGEGITELGNYALQNCTGLKKVILPSTLERVTGYPFRGCTALESVEVKGDKYTTKGDILYTADMQTLALCPPAYKGSINVPKSVTAIADAAFFYCSGLEEVTLPDGLVSLGEDAFCGASALKKISMPDSVTQVKPYTFQACTSLKEVKLSKNLTVIADSMFYDCGALERIKLPEGITSIGENAFKDCSKLTGITLPKNIEHIGNGAFSYCTSIKELVVPEKVTEIPEYMVNACSSLETVVLPKGVNAIGRSAFAGTMKTLKYVLFGGTLEQWNAIPDNRPEAPTWSAMILFNCSSVGDPKNAPVIKTQPEDQSFDINAEAKDTLTAEAEKPKEGNLNYFVWFKNTKAEIEGAKRVSAVQDNGVSTAFTPDTSQQESAYYYCLAVNVDADGAASWTYSDIVSVAVGMNDFEGSGTVDDPYQLTTAADLVKLNEMVASGKSMAGIHLKLTANITLPEDWYPMGVTIDGTTNLQNGKNLHPFSGILDGDNHTITVPEGGLPLLGYVKEAEVRNLNIYGKRIEGYGLVNNFEGVGLSGSAIVIDNVTVKSGTQTLKSGLIGANITTNGFAGCSAGFIATIRNCTVEEGVVIGYKKDQNMIGSIAGRMQGTVENCISNATVYGKGYVGGIIGTRDNAMGQCSVSGCNFGGTIESSGEFSGGIVGGGYTNSTAPNGGIPAITQCSASGSVTGTDKVGGILGGDAYVAQLWGRWTFKNNSFTGRVTATKGTYVGGVIGFLDSLNKFSDITNNYFASGCGTDKGIGFAKYVDTSCETHEMNSGAVYFNTANGTEGLPEVPGCNWKAEHNRTDDPLGADASKLANSKLNTDPVVTELSVAGDYRTQYYTGEAFDFTGMKFTAAWSDGSSTNPDANEITVEGFDTTKRGPQEITLIYKEASAKITITVLKGAKVSFTLMGDHKHDSDQDGIVHTLATGNLETWVPETIYYMDVNDTIHDVLLKAAEEYGFEIMSRGSEYGIYVEGIGWKGQTLKEFDNGPRSGWMFMVNGVHPDEGVGATYVEDGSKIIFHYTDDYKKEESLMFDKQQAEAVEELIAEIPTADKLTEADRESVETARAMYESLTDAQKVLVSPEALKKLKEAEAALAGMQHTWDGGKVTKPATCTQDGVKTYTCTSCGETITEVIKASGHKFGEWKTMKEATVFTPEKQIRTCSVCDMQETREVGNKLKPTIKVNAKTITLKVKQSTKGFKVTGLADGDSVKSYKSGNKKIFKVSKNGKITAGKKAGKAKLTITLASGLKKKVTVKVQNSDVKTTKITGLDKTLKLKKGKKTTLKPKLKPFTSKQKVTYTSSNKKIVKVNSKGVVKAVKPGKAKIAVKSGSKEFVVTVKVTKK